MDFGQLAEAEAPSIAAYKLVKEIEREFKTAADLDETYDFAGPPRCLGLLYRDAPSWPISIGSKRKAREWLDRAAALAPDFPENQLNLAESHVRWHQAAEAEKALKKLEAIWPAARTNLTGEVWEPSWDDWTSRRTAVKAEFEKAFKRAPDLSQFSGVQK
jgi:tetratricopeptide (TPR) repeat protein